MELTRKRSYSFELLAAGEAEDEPLSELETEIALTVRERNQRRKSSVVVYVKKSSWLSRWCALSRPQWKRQHLLFTQDRVIVCSSPKHPYGTNFIFKDLTVQFSKNNGHDNNHFCLLLITKTQSTEISFESKEDLENWLMVYHQHIT